MVEGRVQLEDALRSFPRVQKTEGYVNSDGVFIGSEEHNMPTYVLVEREGGAWLFGGKPVDLISVNGLGEVRWGHPPGGWGGDAGDQAVEAFGLVERAKALAPVEFDWLGWEV